MHVPWSAVNAWLGALLGIILVFAPRSARPAEVETTPLRLVVNPTSLRLAEGGRAIVRVAASSEAPNVSVSNGRIDGLREVASGIYEAEFIPHDSTEPETVIVSAITARSFGWATIDLECTRELVVSAPRHSLVTAMVGDQSFGPVPADARGVAVLRVAVPPGTHRATALGKQYDLHVSDRGFGHVAVERASLDANSSAELMVRVIALTEKGRPWARAKVAMTASQGAVSAPKENTPGVFSARWKLSPGPAGVASLTVRVGGARGFTVAGQLVRTAGAAHRAVIDVVQGSRAAGEVDELTVTGRILDAAGNSTDGQARLVVSQGSGDSARLLPEAVTEWHRSGSGYVGRVQVPRQRAGKQELQLEMIVSGGVRVTRVVVLDAGPPRQLRLEFDERLVADGRSRPLRVAVVDQHGNRTDGTAPLVVTAERGSVGAPVREAAGIYRVGYRAPVAWDDLSDVVHARLDDLEAKASLNVRGSAPRLTIAPKGGFATGIGQWRKVRSPAVGAEIGLWYRSVGLMLEGRWLSFSRRDATSGDGLRVVSSADFYGVDAALAWRRPLLGGMLWLGAGGGGVLISSRARISGLADQKADVLVPAAHAAISLGWPLGPGVPFGEARFDWQANPRRGPVQGLLNSVTFNVGYRLDVL